MLPFVGQLPFPNTPQQVFFLRTKWRIIILFLTSNAWDRSHTYLYKPGI